MSRLIEPTERRPPAWVPLTKLLLVCVLLYLFLGGMDMMGCGLRELGKNPDFDRGRPEALGNQRHREVVYEVFSYADNPLVGLFVGLLATAIFQSSSFTTSFTVGLVVTTPLTLHQAIFIVMGANVGTTVTALAVSFTQVRRAEEFERAYRCAIVHDFFKCLTVLVLLPAEWILWRMTGAGPLERAGAALASKFYRHVPAGQEPTNVLREGVKPLLKGVQWVLVDGLGLSHVPRNVALAILGVVLIFAALLFLTATLRRLVIKRVEQFIDRVLFRNAAIAFLVGLILTSIVQSSSVTTSLVVPLAAAGLLTVRQVFPYTLGASVGTTVTAILASFATSAETPAQAQVGMALAFSHLFFNLGGCLIWYPLRRVPIGMATWLGRLAARSKRSAFLFIAAAFFVLPLMVIGLYWLFG